jgi:hypothetical protein
MISIIDILASQSRCYVESGGGCQERVSTSVINGRVPSKAALDHCFVLLSGYMPKGTSMLPTARCMKHRLKN